MRRLHGRLVILADGRALLGREIRSERAPPIAYQAVDVILWNGFGGGDAVDAAITRLLQPRVARTDEVRLDGAVVIVARYVQPAFHDADRFERLACRCVITTHC